MRKKKPSPRCARTEGERSCERPRPFQAMFQDPPVSDQALACSYVKQVTGSVHAPDRSGKQGNALDTKPSGGEMFSGSQEITGHPPCTRSSCCQRSRCQDEPRRAGLLFASEDAFLAPGFKATVCLFEAGGKGGGSVKATHRKALSLSYQGVENHHRAWGGSTEGDPSLATPAGCPMQPHGWGWQHPTTVLTQGGRRWDSRSWWRSRYLSLGFGGHVAREEHLLPMEIKALSKQLERKHHSCSSLPHGQPAALLTEGGKNPARELERADQEALLPLTASTQHIHQGHSLHQATHPTMLGPAAALAHEVHSRHRHPTKGSGRTWEALSEQAGPSGCSASHCRSSHAAPEENSWGKVTVSQALLHTGDNLIPAVLSIWRTEGKEGKAKQMTQNAYVTELPRACQAAIVTQTRQLTHAHGSGASVRDRADNHGPQQKSSRFHAPERWLELASSQGHLNTQKAPKVSACQRPSKANDDLEAKYLPSRAGLHACMESNSPKGCARAESGSKPLQGLVGPAGDVWKVPGAPGATCAFPQQYTPAGASRPALSLASWFPPPELAQSSACVSPSRRSVCSLFPKDTHCFLLRHPSPQQVPSRPPRGRWQPNCLQELAQRLATLNLTRAGVVALAFESHGHKKRRDLLAEEQPGQADAAQAPEPEGELRRALGLIFHSPKCFPPTSQTACDLFPGRLGANSPCVSAPRGDRTSAALLSCVVHRQGESSRSITGKHPMPGRDLVPIPARTPRPSCRGKDWLHCHSAHPRGTRYQVSLKPTVSHQGACSHPLDPPAQHRHVSSPNPKGSMAANTQSSSRGWEDEGILTREATGPHVCTAAATCLHAARSTGLLLWHSTAMAYSQQHRALPHHRLPTGTRGYGASDSVHCGQARPHSHKTKGSPATRPRKNHSNPREGKRACTTRMTLEGTTHCKGSSTARIRPEQDDMEESSAIRPLPPGPPPPTADAQTQLHSQILLAKQLSTWQLCNLQEAQRSPNRQASTPCFCLAPPVYLPPNKSSSPYQLYKLKFLTQRVEKQVRKLASIPARRKKLPYLTAAKKKLALGIGLFIGNSTKQVAAALTMSPHLLECPTGAICPGQYNSSCFDMDSQDGALGVASKPLRVTRGAHPYIMVAPHPALVRAHLQISSTGPRCHLFQVGVIHFLFTAGIPDALRAALLLVLAEPRKSTQLLLNPRGAARCCAVLQYSINGKTPWQQCKQPPGANFLLSAVRGGCRNAVIQLSRNNSAVLAEHGQLVGGAQSWQQGDARPRRRWSQWHQLISNTVSRTAVAGDAEVAILLSSGHKHRGYLRGLEQSPCSAAAEGELFLPLLTRSPTGTLSKLQKPLARAIPLCAKPHQSLKRNTHKKRSPLPKFLQKALMSACFASHMGIHALCGTGGHFPAAQNISFKARGLVVIAALAVMKYHLCGEQEKTRISDGTCYTRGDNEPGDATSTQISQKAICSRDDGCSKRTQHRTSAILEMDGEIRTRELLLAVLRSSSSVCGGQLDSTERLRPQIGSPPAQDADPADLTPKPAPWDSCPCQYDDSDLASTDNTKYHLTPANPELIQALPGGLVSRIYFIYFLKKNKGQVAPAEAERDEGHT
ncbi:hypothetical protein Anapl_11030 [Anas platyrhynchos]|uniref:Uncharacterized protein n=1 Tax=Anas platyrhynchos TaxID=8839 RepID=R0L9L4_ANAPL|nr:hypothetical protein Anapl_11030 [Anas platyrhynchos]